MLRLQTLQTQLGNISLQATLIIGFAVSMFSGDTIQPLMDADSQRCLYKSWAHMLLGILFYLSLVACVCYCFIVVTLAAFLKQSSQQSALLVSTRAAVANTQKHITLVYRLFVRSVFAFIVSAALLIWLYAGLPSKIKWDETAAEKAFAGANLSTDVSELDNGSWEISCLNSHSASDSQLRDNYGYAVGISSSVLICVLSVWGIYTYMGVESTYEQSALLSWYANFEIEEKRRAAAASAAAGDAKKPSAEPSAASPDGAKGAWYGGATSLLPTVGSPYGTFFPSGDAPTSGAGGAVRDDGSDPDSVTGEAQGRGSGSDSPSEHEHPR